MSFHSEDWHAMGDKVAEFAEAHPKAIVIALVVLFAFFAGYALG